MAYPHQTGPDNYVDEIGAACGALFFLDQAGIGRAVCHSGAGWRTIFSTVVFGALSGEDERAGLMDAYVRYLLTGQGLEQGGRRAAGPMLAVSPSPVRLNHAVRISASTDGALAVYDAFGRRVSGWHGRRADWVPQGLEAGTYFVRLTTAAETVTRPLVICR